MTKKDKALMMAIEFMETLTIDVGIKTWNEKSKKEAIQACKEALEQPAQEPVAWGNPTYNYAVHHKVESSWQGLSGDELDEIVDRLNVSLILHCSIADFVNAIEAKLKEKNYG